MVLMRGRQPVPLTPQPPPIEVAIVVPPGAERDVAVLAAAIAAKLGARVRVTRYEAASIAEVADAARRAIDDGCDVLAPVGGDETVAVAFAAIGGRDVPLLLMPFGAATEHARAVGHRTIPDVVAALDSGRVRRVDMVRCSFRASDGRGHRAIVCPPTGFGLVAEIRRLWQLPACDEAVRIAPTPRLTGLEMVAEDVPLLCRRASF